MLECSEVLCECKAEVYCECETPAVIYCSEHGYEHFKETGHDLEDLKPKNLGLHFSHSDWSLYTGQPLSISDVLSGPSFFQKRILKYLGQKSRYELEKIGIFPSAARYLFQTTLKFNCFLCQKKVSHLKLHLSKSHNLNEDQRQDYWLSHSNSYSETGLIMNDVV
jgi:hypothetical protein